MNIGFLMVSGILVYLGFFSKHKDISHMKEMAPKSKTLESFLKYLAIVSYVWLAIGILIKILAN